MLNLAIIGQGATALIYRDGDTAIKLYENTTALVMAYVDGKPILWPRMDKGERRDAIHTLVKLQCKVHRIHADCLPKQIDLLSWKIERVPYLDKLYKDKLLYLLRRLDNGSNNLCHGDFHPLNILYDGNKHWIIDWVDATAGNPLVDVCRTYLIFKQYMNRSSGIYIQMFCQESGIKQADVLAWLPVIAAARLNENMDDKIRAELIEFIRDSVIL